MSSKRLRQNLRLCVVLIALFFIAAITTSNALPRDAAPKEPAKGAEPIAKFAKLIGGEWRQTAASGTSMYHTWSWGPGQYSIRRRTVGSGANGEPWHELQVYYWHPSRKQIRVLGMSPYSRGISEGIFQFDGEHAEGFFDLYQAKAIHRKMSINWAFDGQDKYRDKLLESTGPDRFMTLVEFEHIRNKSPAMPRPRTVEAAKPSEYLQAFIPLLGYSWEAKSESIVGNATHTQTSFEYVPIADAIYARVTMLTMHGEPTHLLDMYIYHHTGAKVLRCLALSNRGGVYQGDVTIRDGGSLQADLKSDEAERIAQYIVRFDFDKDGTVRDRAWQVEGTENKLLSDIRHKRKLLLKK